MTTHQTQSEQAPATSRRALATGSTLLAVLVLMSMLPPSAGLVAVTALGDDPVRIALRDVGHAPRREARVHGPVLRVTRVPLERSIDLALPPRDLIDTASATSNVASDHRDEVVLATSTPLVRDAWLALPPPRA